MKTISRLALLALGFAAAPAALFAQTDIPERGINSPSAIDATPETIIRAWPERARQIASAMIEKYGQPQRFGENVLAWDGNGAWKRTLVHRGARPHYRLVRDKDYLEQIISYRVPDDKIAALKSFRAGLKYDASKDELSARSESEKLNYLALNLADEIVTGKRSVEDARAFYRKERELSIAGKSSPYVEEFLFPIDEVKTGAGGDDRMTAPESGHAAPDESTPLP